MEAITNANELAIAISILEKRHELQSQEIKKQVALIHESIRPINLIKNSLQSIIHSPEVKADIVDFAVGASTGYLAKKIVLGKSESLVREIIGEVVEMVVFKGVANNSKEIIEMAKSWVVKWLGQGTKETKSEVKTEKEEEK